MNDITCPHCDQKFEIDAAGYADIVKQVRGAEFESEIHERLKEAEERHLIQIELAKKEVMEEGATDSAEKEKRIAQLENEISSHQTELELARTVTVIQSVTVSHRQF